MELIEDLDDDDESPVTIFLEEQEANNGKIDKIEQKIVSDCIKDLATTLEALNQDLYGNPLDD